MTNVLIVEDSRIQCDSIAQRLSDSGDFNVYMTIENAANAEILCMSGKIDLILMDICTADDESGIKAAKKIKERYPGIKIILMTSMPEHSFIEKTIESKCEGFWYKEFGDTRLVDICRKIMTGEKLFPESTPNVKVGVAESNEFSHREFQVIRELASGKTYGEIAENLNISENTVKFHVKNILSKTGFKNTVQLVSEVVEKRLVLPSIR